MNTLQNHNIQFDFALMSNLMEAFLHTESSVSKLTTLTYNNVGNIKGLSLNCSYGYGIIGQSNTSFGAVYSHSMGRFFDFTVSGEYSDGSVTSSLMIVHKYTGINFGIEMKLTGSVNELKKGCYIVINVPICGTQFSFKCDVTNILVSLLTKPSDNRVPRLGYTPDSKPTDNDSTDDDPDKSGAADTGCDLISIEADFVQVKIYQKIYEYETIKEYEKLNGHAKSQLTTFFKKEFPDVPEEVPANILFRNQHDEMPREFMNRDSEMPRNFLNRNFGMSRGVRDLHSEMPQELLNRDFEMSMIRQYPRDPIISNISEIAEFAFGCLVLAAAFCRVSSAGVPSLNRDSSNQRLFFRNSARTASGASVPSPPSESFRESFG